MLSHRARGIRAGLAAPRDKAQYHTTTPLTCARRLKYVRFIRRYQPIYKVLPQVVLIEYLFRASALFNVYKVGLLKLVENSDVGGELKIA